MALSATDLAVLNSAEPFRVSSYDLLRRNLLDPTLNISVCVVYLLCKLFTRQSNQLLSFIVLFAFIFFIVNHHIESYRSFVVVEKNVKKLSNDYHLRRKFLSTHLGNNPRIAWAYAADNNNDTNLIRSNDVMIAAAAAAGRRPAEVAAAGGQPMDEPEAIEQQTVDSFHWMNRIIVFFWPYLSHLIHYELNEFFRNQIESGSLARSKEGKKRLFYAIIRQLDTNILVIEKCQLGDQSPFIKSLRAFEDYESTLEDKSQDCKSKRENRKKKKKEKGKNGLEELNIRTVLSDLMTPPDPNEENEESSYEKSSSNKGKTLVYDINFQYNGDMDISVIYRYFCCCSSRVGLKDVYLHFNLRIILGPLSESIPFIDKVTFTLLELPEFGYKGIALAELAELRIVRSVINRLIKDHLLYPRTVSVSLRELLETLINGPRSREQRSTSNKPQPEQRASSVSRIEPHPGKILSSSDLSSSIVAPPVNTATNQKDPISFWTKLTANALICGCVSANFLLRCCRGNKSEADDSTARSESKTATARRQPLLTKASSKIKSSARAQRRDTWPAISNQRKSPN